VRCSTCVLLCAFFAGVPSALAEVAEVPADWRAPMLFRAGEPVEHPTVPVFRGSAMPPRAPEPFRPVPEWQMGAGEKLWFVDPATGRVIACRERGTFTVGRRAIECTERRLRALDG
jgi:hypothetical protein